MYHALPVELVFLKNNLIYLDLLVFLYTTAGVVGQRTLYKSLPLHMWVQGIKRRLSGLAASTLPAVFGCCCCILLYFIFVIQGLSV